MGNLVLIAFTVIAGGILPFQAGANARLGRTLPSGFHGALVSFSVGTLIMIIVTTLVGWRGFSLANVREAPWWSWIGGLIGATFVSVGLFAAPKLGATLYLSGLIVGQMVGGLIVDHFGLVGISPQPISWQKLGGVALLLAGMYLVQRGGMPTPAPPGPI